MSEATFNSSLYDRNSGDPAPAPPDPKASSAADRMYGPSLVTSAIARRDADLATVAGASAAERRKITDDFVDIYRRTHLPEGVLARIAEGAIDARIAAARPSADPSADKVAHAQRVAAWKAESREVLRLSYGPQDAEALLERAQRFIKATPALERYLKDGLESRPDILLEIVGHLFSTGWR
jgi:hypothetical protein